MSQMEKTASQILSKLESGIFDRGAARYLAHCLLEYMNGDYLQEIVERHPHEHRKVEKLLDLFRELIIDLHLIQKMPDDEAKRIMKLWLERFRVANS
jgi:hypothetical protein